MREGVAISNREDLGVAPTEYFGQNPAIGFVLGKMCSCDGLLGEVRDIALTAISATVGAADPGDPARAPPLNELRCGMVDGSFVLMLYSSPITTVTCRSVTGCRRRRLRCRLFAISAHQSISNNQSINLSINK